MNEQQLTERLDAVAAAEARLLRTAESFVEDDLSHPSRCEGWTRGHVLAHVALNAHSLVNLFGWARTGVETPQYPSWEARDADIERLAGRAVAEHRDALAAAGSAFAGAARRVPPDRWSFPVRGIGGDPQPVETFLFGRLREVEIHHVDLHAGYGPADWPDGFVRRVLEQVPARLGPRVPVTFDAAARDLDVRIRVGDGSPDVEVAGPGGSLLAWLLGRADGADLDVGGGPLPSVPVWG